MGDQEAARFRAAAAAVGARLADFLEASAAGEGRVVSLPPIDELAGRLELQRLIRDGGLLDEALEPFLQSYLAAATRLHHPGYLAHQVAVPHPAGALGALVDTACHNPMAIYEMGPAAAAIEYVLVNWMLDKGRLATGAMADGAAGRQRSRRRCADARRFAGVADGAGGGAQASLAERLA